MNDSIAPMNRRSFLQSAAMAIAALGIDPEQLIWQPTKAFSIPKTTYAEIVGMAVRPDAFFGRTRTDIHIPGHCVLFKPPQVETLEPFGFAISKQMRATAAEIRIAMSGKDPEHWYFCESLHWREDEPQR